MWNLYFVLISRTSKKILCYSVGQTIITFTFTVLRWWRLMTLLNMYSSFISQNKYQYLKRFQEKMKSFLRKSFSIKVAPRVYIHICIKTSEFWVYLYIVATKQVKVEHKTLFLNNRPINGVVAHSITALSQVPVNVYVFMFACVWEKAN